MFSRIFGVKDGKDEKNGEFMKGCSILSELNQSNYGKISDVMNKCFDTEFNQKYALPKIVVTGDENVGKSSLLENITKCPIFPRNNGFCTRCPIHIKMTYNSIEKYYVKYVKYGEFDGITKNINNKEEIAPIIEKHMNSIDKVSSEKIVIGIQGPNIPTLELYDLPGIIAHPKEISKQIIKICKKYLSKPNVITLCIVPATISSLSTSASIALIKELNIEEHSILVLTKIDTIDTSNKLNLRQLVQRIIMDCEKYDIDKGEDTKNLLFSKTVGIINRTHDDSRSLEENEEHEKKWYDDNIIAMVKNSDNTEIYIKFITELTGKLGIKNLLKIIDNRYSEFIQTNWKPTIEKQINKEIINLEQNLKIIGDDYCLDKFDHIVNDINRSLKEMYRMSYIENENNIYYSSLEEREEINTINDVDECNFYNEMNNYIDIDSDSDSDITQSSLKKLIEHIETNFTQYIIKDNNYKLYRFDVLKDCIIGYIRQMCNEYFTKNKNRITNTLLTRIDNYYIDCEFGDKEKFNLIVNKMLRGLVFEQVYHNWNFAIDKYVHFCENENTAKNRNEILYKIKELKIHLEKITSIVV
jgi:hypothetical protein